MATQVLASGHATMLCGQLVLPGVMVIVLDRNGHLQVGSAAVDHPIAAPLIALARAVHAAVGEITGERGAPVERAACIHCRQDVARVDDVEAIRTHSMTCARSPVVQRNAELERQLKLAKRGISYALERTQTDPDVRYYCGWGTEMFARLVDAEAAITGRDPEGVSEERRIDHQPDYRRRDPHVVVLRKQLDEMEADRGRV